MDASRQKHIEHLLQTRGDCSVAALAGELGVSEMTIRRDLAALARDGRVIRTHGGAIPGEKVLFEFQFLERASRNDPAKQAIAATAARLVRSGQTVMMDSGTTTLALARSLRGLDRLTIMTTSLPIAAALQHARGLRVLLLGGFVQPDAPDLGGALTEANLEQLHADVAFIGADGIDLQGNVSNASPEVARMLGKMAAAATATYVVADSSKIGRPALMRFGNLARWRGLITDLAITPKHRTTLARAGVNLILADPTKPEPVPQP